MATPNIVPRAAGGGGLGAAAKGWGGLFVTNITASSATEGGKIVLATDDDAVMADNHRLGVIEFKGAEDAGSGAGLNTLSIGARIQAICRDAWDGSNNDADLQFYTTDGTTESLVLTLDADKLATFAGAVSVAGNLTFDSVALTAIQTSEESFVDNDTSIMTSAAIDDRINKKSIRVYGNTIKILFQDFMANDDIGVTKTVQFKDDGTTGLKAGHDNIELYAFIDIPEGKKATDVIIYGTPTSLAVDVFEMDVDASGLGSTLGTGTIGTSLDFTDVDSTATNFLAIKVTTTSFTGDRVYGGLLTIADIA